MAVGTPNPYNTSQTLPNQTDFYVYAGTNRYGPFTYNDYPNSLVQHSISLPITAAGNGWFVIAARNTTQTGKVAVGVVCVDANTTTGTGSDTVATPQQFSCYWCVPTRGDTIACDVNAYSQIYSSLNNGDVLTQVQILNATDLFNSLNTVACGNGSGIILDPVIGSVKTLNEQCCIQNGGTWTLSPYAQNVFGTNGVCLNNITQTCVSTYNPTNNVLVTTLGDPTTLISQQCCTTPYYWSTGDIMVNNTITQTSSIFEDNTAISFLGYKQPYCSVCPTGIQYSFLQTTSSANSVKTGQVIGPIIVKDNTGQNLSQNCCTSYGFNYNTQDGYCYLCPSTFNTAPEYPNLITGVGTTTSLSQSCCTGWYGTPTDTTYATGCYQCPIDNNYIISNGEVLYAGQSLTQTCCNTYANKISSNPSTIFWNSTQNKCLVSTSPAGGGPTFSLPMTLLNTSSDGVVTTGTLQSEYPIDVKIHNAWVTGPFGGTNIPIPNGSSSDEVVLRINIRTTGSANPIKIKSLGYNLTLPTFGSHNSITNLATDIYLGPSNVNFYYTGPSSVFVGDTINFRPQGTVGNLLTPQTLVEGDNYFWITFKIRSTATAADYVYVKLDNIGMSVAPYGSANNQLYTSFAYTNNGYSGGEMKLV